VNLIMMNSCECKSRVINDRFDPSRCLFPRNQGDPFDISIILWTRAVPLPASDGELPSASVPVCVSYKIGTDQNLSGQPINTGEVFTTYDVDFTVKVEATGLKADTQYFYQFADCTNAKTVSPIGATRTLSSPNSEFFIPPRRNR
jgi:alkaline phosphatase D